jgi:FdhD protein
MNCLPDALEDLILGFLASEGLVAGPGAVHQMRVSADRTKIEAHADVDPYRLVAFKERLAISSGCGGGASATPEDVSRSRSPASFRPADISSRMTELHHASPLFRETGGVHAAAVTDGLVLSAFAEDLGRHNAVDKTIGRCLTRGIALDQRALLTTGRLSADILSKAIRVGLPVVVSRGAVTSRAIELAGSADVAAVGFARGYEMNVYTAPWRLGLAERNETAGPRDGSAP